MNRLARFLGQFAGDGFLFVGQLECLSVSTRSSGQCHHTQFRPRQFSRALVVVLLVANGFDQRLKRRLEVRLVVDEQHVLAEEAGVQRFRLEADPVPAEQESAADHVHGAGDHRGARRVGRPLAIVRKLPAKRTNSQVANFRPEVL